jgi:hypothetical protein
VWCPALIENIRDAYKNRRRPVPEKPKLPVEITPASGISTMINGISTSRSTQIKTKQNKTNIKTTSAVAERVETDPLYHVIKQAFESKNGGMFTNYGREGKAIHGLINNAKARMPDDPASLLNAMLDAFWRLKTGDMSAKGFWRLKPFLPSVLLYSWDGVLETLRADTVDPAVMAIINGGAA